MTWVITMIVGLVLVLGGVAILLHARTLRRSLPPRAPEGTLDGTLPDHGIFGVPYQRRDRASYLTQRAVGAIAVAGVIVLVSGWHLLGH